MWFDEIMDDCKNALKIAHDNKGIFVPIFVKLGINLLLFAVIFTFFIVYIIGLVKIGSHASNVPQILLRQLPVVIILGFISYILIVVVSSLIEVGSINLIKAAADGLKPKASHFFEGIRNYFFKVFGGKLLIHVIVLVLSPVIIALYLIYAVIVGTLSAGWGLIFLGVVIGIFFTSWTTIVVVDNFNPIKAIGLGMKLGKKYFWGMFVVILASALISSYMSTVFGPLPTIIGGWFIGGVILTYFKVVILLIYTRKRNELV